MSGMIASNLHFANYGSLLRGFCPQLRSMSVFNQQQVMLWTDGAATVDDKALARQLQAFRDGEGKPSRITLSDEVCLELIDLRNAAGKVLITLVLEMDGTRPNPGGLLSNPKILPLNELLLGEYEQSLELESKETELNAMTDELTRRYEELNLIYKAEDQAVNIYHGRELLRQLVVNTARFMNVDIIYLFIAAENIAMHEFRNDKAPVGADTLFEHLRGPAYQALQKRSDSIVINQDSDNSQFEFGEETIFKHVVSAIVNAENEVIGLLAVASQNFNIDFSNSDRNLVDVMSRKASKIAQAHFDPLTGLENSTSFELIIKDLLKKSWGTDVKHAIANIDIDRMAVVNDIGGRDAGDHLIKKVGHTLATMVRSRDVVARIGSDKFGVLLENCDLKTAGIVMRKIADEVSRIDMMLDGDQHEVSISTGIAPVSAQAQSVTAILNAAETARNVSKERGRNGIHVLDIDDRDLMRRKEQIRWVGRIQAALRDNDFELYAQVIEPLSSDGGRTHHEILLRLRDTDGAIIPPGAFLPAAESFFLMSSIDFWVIDTALRAISAFSSVESNLSFPISINLSGQSLNEPSMLAKYIGEKIKYYQVNPADICFEITESAAIANIDEARLFIDQVRTFGCRFSLDDFGTGLSSFAYLKNLQVDYLKIDGSFVVDVVSDEVSASMVSAITQVGHAMQLKTVAEFVEDDLIRQKLVEIGVDFGQGYSLGKPRPLQDILASLHQEPSKRAQR